MTEGDAPTGRWAIVASRFNETVMERLLGGARECLTARGADDVLEVRVAGAMEVPQAVAALVRAGEKEGHRRLRGIVALAAVVRGETPHFDHVCSTTTHALMRIAVESGVPVGFGVLTCDTHEQALARSGGDAGNKGYEAAAAAWDLAATLGEHAPPPP